MKGSGQQGQDKNADLNKIAEENLQLREAVKRLTTKLEHKNRKLEIEAALERVRARTMTMQKSDELAEVAQLLFQQFRTLKIETLVCGYVFIQEEKDIQRSWTVLPDGTLMPEYIDFPLTGDRILNERYKAWKAKVPLYKATVEGEENKQHHQFLSSRVPARVATDIFDHVPYWITFYSANFSQGYLHILATESISEEDEVTVVRFAKVFDQTYTRFLDLQKAEAQVHEAQIEGALERVRSRSLAMNHSVELEQVVVSLFDRFVELGLSLDGALIFIFEKEKRNIRLWIATNQLPAPVKIDLPYDEKIKNNAIIKDLWNAIENGEHIFNRSYSGKTKNEYFKYVVKNNKSKIPGSIRKIQIETDSWTANFAAEKNSLVGFDSWSGHTIILEDFQTLIRFARVFEQAYTRFLDLQKAEAQAREAIKASSLDRVRAQIASMRTVGDLQQITPLIWKELNALEIPFVRCGVFIINESSAHVQVYLSSSEGHSLGSLDLPFDTSELTFDIVNHWRKGSLYTTHWNKEKFLNWMQTLIKAGQVQNREIYQGASQPPESLNLHFIPFKQGMLYVGNISPLEPKELELGKTLADSFSIAYARYEDFRQLEEAKNQIEKTFTYLKATQFQLIQSEKMAALGELTAGIAHEIQNPLNFVNNFSEVSNELIDEMNEELNKGDIDQAMVIASDIKQNLEKILHHGKRADGIVKGMLQHSRTSSGMKEPMELNKLADEYFRLAYHGLRAKDKSFNATLKTDFDPSLGTVPVIPQDLGRVMLNLINNAFYAVTEKKKQQLDGYEPTVSVSTKKVGNKVLISVKDNGNGIPPKVMDKIFQPFFTTKPTGQGTGLGLSMSYDIVKAHGGELKVDTKEGEGAEFIVVLPV